MPTSPPNAPPSIELSTGVGNSLAFERINQPGTYLCNWSGHLLRIPEDAVQLGRSPTLQIRAKEQLYVTKLSDDPFVPLTKARMVASDLDHAVNF